LDDENYNIALDFVYIPDSDEEKQMKKAIALSLGETIVLANDEFDRMCDKI